MRSTADAVKPTHAVAGEWQSPSTGAALLPGFACSIQRDKDPAKSVCKVRILTTARRLAISKLLLSLLLVLLLLLLLLLGGLEHPKMDASLATPYNFRCRMARLPALKCTLHTLLLHSEMLHVLNCALQTLLTVLNRSTHAHRASQRSHADYMQI